MSAPISYRYMKKRVVAFRFGIYLFCYVLNYTTYWHMHGVQGAVDCEWTFRGSLVTGTARTASTSTSAAVITVSVAVTHALTCSSVTAIARVVCWPPWTSAQVIGTAAAATTTLPAAAAASSAAPLSGTSQWDKVQPVVRVTLLVDATAPQFVLGGKLATGSAQGDQTISTQFQ
jgi:hypothetical protein